MTVYARSDLASVTISPAHGGCGEVHSRPVVEGAPVSLWSLTCHTCEDVLRSDPLWSSTVSGVPETPDEERVRKDQERRGVREQADATALALSELAKLGDLPSAIAKLAASMRGEMALPEATMDMMCTQGHRNPRAAKFCSTCGLSMSDDGPGPKVIEMAKSDDGLEQLTLADLRALAKKEGAKAGKNKDEQISAIREHRAG